MKAVVFKTLVFTHRYVGIAIGWLMLVWCLSGLVMLYVEYPELGERERLVHLQSLHADGCCNLQDAPLTVDARIASFNVEMLGGTPLLRVMPGPGSSVLLDMRTGSVVDAVTEGQALQVAGAWQSANARLATVNVQQEKPDQWTVYPRYRMHRPLYHVALNDAAGTEVYVSRVTGEAVQKTTRLQRFWNWLGAVPHWVYFTAIRDNATLWNNLVIYSSLLGCFLTLFGLYLGIWQLRRKSDDRLHSPYRGWKYWHHVPGLIFGVLVLSWVFSGLMSMQPWGFLESGGHDAEARQLRGGLPDWQAVRHVAGQLPAAELPADTVRVSSSILHGKLYLLATDRQGDRTRFDAQWRPSPLSADEIRHAGQALGATRVEALYEEDAFYYAFGSIQAPLPAVRLTMADGTRVYLDATTGEVLTKIDSAARGYRWLHLGLHRMDFTAWMRSRPVWDVLMWTLMLGVTTVCTTGMWLGVRYLRRR